MGFVSQLISAQNQQLNAREASVRAGGNKLAMFAQESEQDRPRREAVAENLRVKAEQGKAELERYAQDTETAGMLRESIKNLQRAGKPTVRQAAQQSSGIMEMQHREELVRILGTIGDPTLARQVEGEMKAGFDKQLSDYQAAEYSRLSRLGQEQGWWDEGEAEGMDQALGAGQADIATALDVITKQKQQAADDAGRIATAQTVIGELRQLEAFPIPLLPGYIDPTEWQYRLQWMRREVADWEMDMADPRFDPLKEGRDLRDKMFLTTQWAMPDHALPGDPVSDRGDPTYERPLPGQPEGPQPDKPLHQTGEGALDILPEKAPRGAPATNGQAPPSSDAQIPQAFTDALKPGMTGQELKALAEKHGLSQADVRRALAR